MWKNLRNILFASRSRGCGGARGGQRRSFRPSLEVLEDRRVPTFVVQGDHLLVIADTPNDTFALTAIPNGKPQVDLNGDRYTGDMSVINNISFQGMTGGQNTAFVTDTTGYLNTLLHVGGGQGNLTGASYTLDMTDMPSIIATGDAHGYAQLYGSPDSQNTYQGTPAYSVLTNDASTVEVSGFGRVAAYHGTPEDVAFLYGSASTPNHFEGSAQATEVGGTTLAAIMFSSNFDEASGFTKVFAHAGTADDIWECRGSLTDPSTYVSSPGFSRMYSATFNMEGFGFRWTGAVAGTAVDVAYLHGSTTSQNTLLGNQTDALGRSDTHLTSSVHSDEVVGFSTVYVYAGTAADVAHLWGENHSTGQDSIVSGINDWGNAYLVDAHGFGSVQFN